MSKCRFLLKNSKECGKKCIGNLDFCHLKKHHNDREKYENEIERLKNEFDSVTFDRNTFKIELIDRDGACMFKCMAIYLMKNLEKFSGIVPDIYNQIKAIMDSDVDKEDSVSELVQLTLKDWVLENKDYIFPKFDMTVAELIPLVHGEEGIVTLEDYEKYFSIYAGDFDFIVNEMTVNGKKKMVKTEIPERWGTMLELFAFHTIFSVNINIYLLKKFDPRSCKVVVCTNRSKNFRFYLSESIDEYSNKNTMNLYFNTMRNSSHYQLLLNVD